MGHSFSATVASACGTLLCACYIVSVSAPNCNNCEENSLQLSNQGDSRWMQTDGSKPGSCEPVSVRMTSNSHSTLSASCHWYSVVTFKGPLEGKKENSFIDAPDSPLQGYGTEQEKVLLWEGDGCMWSWLCLLWCRCREVCVLPVYPKPVMWWRRWTRKLSPLSSGPSVFLAYKINTLSRAGCSKVKPILLQAQK